MTSRRSVPTGSNQSAWNSLSSRWRESPSRVGAITVTFTPTATGTRSAWVAITDNGGGSPQHVALSGDGT
jgi:hypothetical protein